MGLGCLKLLRIGFTRASITYPIPHKTERLGSDTRLARMLVNALKISLDVHGVI